MANVSTHLAQADHNREVARFLTAPPRHDWAITAAFYASVHYFEAWLFDQPEQHSETSVPTGADGRLRYTVHAWRERLIQKALSKDAFTSFRKLHENSEIARYLNLFQVGRGAPPSWTPAPAPSYFSPSQAQTLVEKDLERFRTAVKAELCALLEGLNLERRNLIVGRLVRKKVLQHFRDPAELLSKSESELHRDFGAPEVALLKTALSENGMTFRDDGRR